VFCKEHVFCFNPKVLATNFTDLHRFFVISRAKKIS